MSLEIRNLLSVVTASLSVANCIPDTRLHHEDAGTAGGQSLGSASSTSAHTGNATNVGTGLSTRIGVGGTGNTGVGGVTTVTTASGAGGTATTGSATAAGGTGAAASTLASGGTVNSASKFDAGGTGIGAGGLASNCSPVCSGTTPYCEAGSCVACQSGKGQCDGNVPQLCQQGAWVNQPPCLGNTPICNNGMCTVGRVFGGFVTLAAAPAGTVYLRNQYFEALPRVCNTVSNSEICVIGGLRP